jgi:flagellar biosynthesis/type III secretory pathway protein FliH
MSEEKLFTVKDLERAGERGIAAAQVALAKDVVKEARRMAVVLFEEGKDEGAVALRTFGDSFASLIEVFEKKQAALASKTRASQITDTVIDATLEVHP